MSAHETFILMVEDDPEIRRMVGDLLRGEGYEVVAVESAAGMDQCLATRQPNLLMLDLMLPGEDGLSICRRIRQTHRFPILMLTAKSHEVDIVVGLEMGADDYLSKPFGPRELLARVRALLRRGHSPAETAASRRHGFAGFVIDLDMRSVSDPDGEPLPLTTSEFDLLACFVQRPRRVLSRDQILDMLRGHEAQPFDRTVDMLVSRLRKKLDRQDQDTPLISTVRNGGYVFTAAVQKMA
ncbi:response regulator [Oryzibacter oryziterrae]|uniref:response regulator n=1 Tax=Oryzibacter oryziterrae TaxID=2766474 RepID=UPI001F18441A|nr:response regulator transcription factor [Oryzibacter oryziterrae]